MTLVQNNEWKELKHRFDFIVCGAGSSGSVVARRLAELEGATVLLIEAGGSDEVPEVLNAAQWRNNLSSERDWCFPSEPNVGLNGRVINIGMGKVLGGGSSINAMGWMRGHKADWDLFAEVSDTPDWSHEAVRKTFLQIENWRGQADDERGNTGLLSIEQATPTETTRAVFEAANSIGIPSFNSLNGRLLESVGGGAALIEFRMHEGQRLSLFRDYVGPFLGDPKLTVLTGTMVRRVICEGRRAVGVEIASAGETRMIHASGEIILCLGAVETPCTLIRSGIGDAAELSQLGIKPLEHLPGVGINLQEHLRLPGFVWERVDTQEPVPMSPVVNLWAKSSQWLSSPDITCVQMDGTTLPVGSGPRNAFTLMPGIVRPVSRGKVSVRTQGPDTAPVIHTNYLESPADLQAMLAAVDLARNLAHSAPLKPMLGREALTAGLDGENLEQYIRNNVQIYWHTSCTARMGTDEMSVVNGSLQVYGIERLRIADASVFPRIPTGLTMAPAVIVGERAAEFIKRDLRQQENR
jgi:choline dehydrogenase